MILTPAFAADFGGSSQLCILTVSFERLLVLHSPMSMLALADILNFHGDDEEEQVKDVAEAEQSLEELGDPDGGGEPAEKRTRAGRKPIHERVPTLAGVVYDYMCSFGSGATASSHRRDDAAHVMGVSVPMIRRTS